MARFSLPFPFVSITSCRVLLITSSVVVSITALVCPRDAEAQRYRYMDSSGNLHFVDSLGEIPRQYRQQVIPPTPTPALTTRQRNELKRAQDRQVKTRNQQMEKKKREIERLRRSIERDQKLQSSKGGSLPGSAPSQKAPAREDDIEVIR